MRTQVSMADHGARFPVKREVLCDRHDRKTAPLPHEKASDGQET